MDEFGPTDPYLLQLSDLWSEIEIKEDVYSRALEDLVHTTQCIDNAKDDKETGVHIINTISPYRSTCVVEKGSLKEKWIIQDKRLSLAEKNVTKAWKEYEHAIAFLEGLSQLQNLLHEYEAQEPQFGDVEIDRSFVILNLSYADEGFNVDTLETTSSLEPVSQTVTRILKLQQAEENELDVQEEISYIAVECREVQFAIKCDIIEMEGLRTLKDPTRIKILPNFKFRKKIIKPTIIEKCGYMLYDAKNSFMDMDNVDNSFSETVLKWPPLDFPRKYIVRVIMKLGYPGLEMNNGYLSWFNGYSLGFASYYRVFDRGKCNRIFFSSLWFSNKCIYEILWTIL